jgi:hypothetical protein
MSSATKKEYFLEEYQKERKLYKVESHNLE